MRTRTSRLALLLLALALAAPVRLRAEPKAFVARPRPLPVAHSFLVAELGFMTQVVGTKATPGDDHQYVSDHGVMFNRSETFAVGLVVHGEAGDRRSRLGPAIRVRRWIGGHSALDLQAGAMVFGGEKGGIDFRGPSPHVQATLSAGDVVAIQAQAQLHAVHLRGDYAHVGGQPPTGIDEDHNDVVAHLGIRMGTVPGVYGSVILALVGTFLYIALSNYDG
jgi:hypothetical protein